MNYNDGFRVYINQDLLPGAGKGLPDSWLARWQEGDETTSIRQDLS